ncbi:MAG: biotin/lipoyl-containing protein [Clostridiaceae bacterium]
MKKYNIFVNGVAYKVEVEEVKGEGGQIARNVEPTPSAPKKAAAPSPKENIAPEANNSTAGAPIDINSDAEKIQSPMPGTIVDIRVAPGDKITSGQVMLILEAMKMENEIVAPRAGTIERVFVSKGQSVNAGDVMISIQ